MKMMLPREVHHSPSSSTKPAFYWENRKANFPILTGLRVNNSTHSTAIFSNYPSLPRAAGPRYEEKRSRLAVARETTAFQAVLMLNIHVGTINGALVSIAA